MKRFRHRRLTAYCVGWNSTTPQSTPAGSTWWRSRLACCVANVSIGASARLRVLLAQIAAWQRQRNNTRARIKWMFTTERARIKLAHAYPHPSRSHNHCAGVLSCSPFQPQARKFLCLSFKLFRTWPLLSKAGGTIMKRRLISREQLLRQERLAKPIRDIAWKAQERLCLAARAVARAGKLPTMITAAIARELAGFIWAIAKQVQSVAS